MADSEVRHAQAKADQRQREREAWRGVESAGTAVMRRQGQRQEQQAAAKPGQSEAGAQTTRRLRQAP